MDIWIIVLSVVIGMILGIFLGLVMQKRVRTVGTLQIDRSQRSRGPFIFLELDEDIDWYKYKEVKLRVLNQDLAYRE